MAASPRLQRFYPWLIAACVLASAFAARHVSQRRQEHDAERFRAALAETAPKLLAGAEGGQQVANRIMGYVARGGCDWGTLDEGIPEWRQQSPAVQGFGYAACKEGRLEVLAQVSRSKAPLHPLGFDLLQVPPVAQAWSAALKDGRGAASQPLTWFDGSEARQILVLRPVYPAGERPGDEASRRAAVQGVAFSVLDVDEVWRHAEAHVDPRRLRIERQRDDAPIVRGKLDRTISVSLGSGYEWKVRVTPGPDLLDTSGAGDPALVMGIGLLLAGLTYGAARAQARSREQTEVLNRELDARVAALTQRLREENAQLRSAQEETELALGRERESSELKSRVVATISHEFRTPLSVILSSTEILKNYHERLSPAERSEHLGVIEDSVAGMSNLIQSVLAFSKAGAGRLEFRPEEVDPEELLSRIVDEVLSATGRRCPIEHTFTGLPSSALLDPTLLRLILANLLGNAVKYSPEGATVSFAATANGATVELTISDRGLGIPDPDQARLFESFRRGANVHGIPGTGLGLSIVRTCTELHGGVLRFTSAVGSGTTFVVTLPTDRLAPRPSLAPFAATPPTSQP